MYWIIPASLASLFSSFVLVFVYFYLYNLEKERSLFLWAMGWSLYSLRFIFELAMVVFPQYHWLFIWNLIFHLFSGLLILMGTFEFLGKKIPKIFIYGATAGCLWLITGALTGFSFIQLTLPLAMFSAYIFIRTGLAFLHYKEFKGLGKKVVGWSFVLWGVHKIDYPILRQFQWFAPWGYSIGAILSLVIGVGIILVYFLKTKQDLASSEEGFRLLAENAEDVIYRYWWIPEPCIEYISPAVKGITGYTPEEYYANPNLWLDLVHSDDRQLLRAMENGGINVSNLNLRWLGKDGQTIWLEMQNSPIYNGSGKLTGIQGIGRDITRRVKAEEVLKRYQLLSENARDIILFVSLEGQILEANQAAVKAYGYSREELLEKTIYDLRASETNHLTRSQMEQAYLNGVIFETIHLRKDGSVFPVEVSSQGTIYFDEKILLSIIRDITERKKAEEAIGKKTAEVAITVAELERSNHELDQFAYVVSHDLKAPLRAIANLSQWIREDLGEAVAGDTLKYMDMLKGRVRRMENFIEGILQYSRVGKIKSNDQKVIVEELLNEIIEEVAPPSRIKIEIGPGMPVLVTDRIRFRQVFANLIGNAVKYHNRSKGHVRVNVEAEEQFYKFSVIDDGPGIAPEYHEKVFEIFQTLQPRDQVESTGIGLSLVKKIVEAKGGSISLKSAAGMGAIFSFLWPKGSQE